MPPRRYRRTQSIQASGMKSIRRPCNLRWMGVNVIDKRSGGLNTTVVAKVRKPSPKIKQRWGTQEPVDPFATVFPRAYPGKAIVSPTFSLRPTKSYRGAMRFGFCYNDL